MNRRNRSTNRRNDKVNTDSNKSSKPGDGASQQARGRSSGTSSKKNNGGPSSKRTGNSARRGKNNPRRRNRGGQSHKKPATGLEKFELSDQNHKALGKVIENHTPKRYGVLFFETFNEAKSSAQNLINKAKEVEQLNIVIKAEGNMNDPELTQYGVVYAGEAWHLIHQRRLEDGWYDQPR